MAIPDWVRKLPHPTYGQCGGGELDCSISGHPIDKMDECFMWHDMDLFAARQLDTPEEIEYAKKAADRLLGIRLRNEKDLIPYARQYYGMIYNRFARMIFKAQ